ncbi:ATP-binding protein [Caldicellulosiruptoraceae bacterium PP1]
MELVLEYDVKAGDFFSAGEASSKIKDTLKKLGFNPEIIKKVAIITYEAEMNIVIHSVGGKIIAKISKEQVEITARDYGPGILDLELAMTEGYSTAPEDIRNLGFGAGMGLPNMKKYSDYFNITSSDHTIVKMIVLNE